MRPKSQKTAAQLRRANRGNVPGVLGMEELKMLAGTDTPERMKRGKTANPKRRQHTIGFGGTETANESGFGPLMKP